MAEADAVELEGTDEPKSNKMLFIIIAVVILLAGGGAAFFLMSGDEPAAEEVSLTDDAAATSAAPAGEGSLAEMGSALYVGMPRPFVFNVPGTGRDRLVQIKVQLLVRGDQNEDTAKKHIPLIEGTLLGVFSTANADALATTAGKEALRSKALQDVQNALLEIENNKIVEKVLFTGFVMQ